MTTTRVYYNLHKRKLSIQQKRINASGKLVWKVVRHADAIFLKDVKFKVSEAGRQRVIKEKKKNVHAFVTGEEMLPLYMPNAESVLYNPYKYSSFVNENEEPIYSSSFASIVGHKKGYKIIIDKY